MKKFILLTLLMFLSITWKGCNLDEENENKPKKNTQSEHFFVTSVFGTETDLGLIINDPIAKKQFLASGPKDEEGKMDSIIFILEIYPESGEWLAHEIGEDYTPEKTTTSTGQTIEYTDLDPPSKKGSIKVTDTKSGTTIWEGKNIDMGDNFFDNSGGARASSKDIKTRRPVTSADMLYLLASAAGCGMGIASLSFGPTLPWGVYNTYQNCKSTKDAIENLYNGNPAFGCITTADNANAFSGFAETISQGGGLGALATGLGPAIVSYASQYAGAGECNDGDGDGGNNNDGDGSSGGPNGNDKNFWDDLFGGGGKGGSWGDPHFKTPDGFFYDFHGYGEFVVSKSLQDNFQVQVRLGNPYSSSVQATLNTAVAVQTGNDVVCVIAKPQGLYINNVLHDLNFDVLPLTGQAAIKKEVEQNYNILKIRTQNNDFVKVRLSSNGSSYFDFDVTINPNRKGKVQGLFGNFDGNQENELQLHSGERVEKSFESLYPKFADDWRIKQEETLFYYEAGTNTATFTKLNFPTKPIYFSTAQLDWAEGICRQAGIDEEPFLSNCTFDVAATEDPEMAKSAEWEKQKQVQSALPPLDLNKIAIQADATIDGKYIRLTDAKSFQAGQAFLIDPLTGDFESEFTFKLSTSNNGGGDGIAFVIAKEIPELKGNPYPGKDGKLGYTGVFSSLAIEFDTWPDAAHDENGNHIAIHTNGLDANNPGHLTRIAYKNKGIIKLSDGMFHKAKIRYTNKKITVFLDGLEVLETNIDIKSKLGLEGSFYIGLTSSTSGSFARQGIYSWVTKNL